MERITPKDVEGVFVGRFAPAARALGADTIGWTIERGSSTNGISWRIFTPSPRGGRSPLPGFSSAPLGCTAREAYEAITWMARGLEAAYYFMTA